MSDEISAVLSSTSNKSAPGISSINYKLLKWAFAASPQRFLDLYNAALTLGYHPWKEALVVVIPKPNKPDYSLPKAYRPIALLECCGKVLEKIIACCVLHDVNSLQLIPTNQFGSRNYSSTVDAGLSIVHTAQAAICTGHVAALLLFDIQGFFNNINAEWAVQIFLDLGFPPSLCKWLCSFLSECRIRLCFNATTSDPFLVLHGTPQGSPLSPLLSAIYTSPLLKHLEALWTKRSLSLYVDDGAISALGPSYRHAVHMVAEGFEEVTSWLAQNGLHAEPEKTELIIFHPKHHVAFGAPIHRVGLCNPVIGEYLVKVSPTVRYLGMFLHHRLDWSGEVKIMACRAQSVFQALSIMGNSI